ncbi:MAG: aminotransferase class IV [Planctomycetota bacterium]|nr:aminotransferase class IV [Planctomycetota bacterium]
MAPASNPAPAPPKPSPAPQVYLNGRFLPRAEATVDVEDRGTLFGDGVYEVLRVYFGKPLALAAHIERLHRSLGGIRLTPPAEAERLGAITTELLERNALREAKVYWQITRGTGPREHAFPAQPRPTLLMTASPLNPIDPASAPTQIKAITAPDERWHNCWIKSLMLLPNLLARQRAAEAGAGEAIFHRDGVVTEGTTSSAYIVREGAVWTHPADRWILGGITRLVLLEEARKAGIAVEERAFGLEDLRSADEVIVSNTTSHGQAVTHIDGQPVGNAQAGPVARRLHGLLMKRIVAECGG